MYEIIICIVYQVHDKHSMVYLIKTSCSQTDRQTDDG